MPHPRLPAAIVALVAVLALPPPAAAEPSSPVVIGWWSYFAPETAANRIPTTTDPNHVVDHFGDPDTYYYEPSGGHGLQADPAVLPVDQAWQAILGYTLAQSDQFSLAPTFTRNESSDLNQFQEAYYGWAFAMLYVPKDHYCDHYQVHIGTVDDGVQAMANATILGYANLGDQDRLIDMVDLTSGALVLRPGINEVSLIHEDQCAVERYVTDVYLTHEGTEVPLAPKSILWGQVTRHADGSPVYKATVTLTGATTDTFVTGPMGFWFFAGLPDGTYTVSVQAGGFLAASQSKAVAVGQALTEAVRVDFALDPGCNCPNGTQCGANGDCLPPCVPVGEFQWTCDDPTAVCVEGYCVTDLCATLTCAPGFECEAGVCIELACTNVCCGAGETCSGGLCVTDNCGAGCGTGMVCAGGTCVDACSVITCVNGLLCQDGRCVPKCDVDPSLCLQDDAGAATADGGIADGSTAGDAPATGDGGGSPRVGNGCGCATPGTPAARPTLWLVAAALLAWRRRRGARGGGGRP